ncbi:MAG: hypothetical protein HYZ29_27610 [Myxococcales bacterium]|nr:hypothetical protein [Myxococcales bacterium]
MAETSANWVEHVLPSSAPLRQWGLTLPFERRARVAYDRELCERITRGFLRRLGGDPELPPLTPARRPPFFISPALRQRLGGLGGDSNAQVEMFASQRAPTVVACRGRVQGGRVPGRLCDGDHGGFSSAGR